MIVYCYDYQCDMSPRAACRLETLGLERVYDYVSGTADWMAAGLPTEGAQAAEPRILDAAHRDVPRCRLDETIADVAEGIAEWDHAVVVGDGDIVLGVVRREALGMEPALKISDVVQDGPVTFRPNLAVSELAAHLQERGVSRAGHHIGRNADRTAANRNLERDG